MKKNTWTTVILIVILLVGLSLLLYPTVSDYWNSFHQSRAIASYAQNVADMDKDRYKEVWQEAEEYNASLQGRNNPYILSEEQQKAYETVLDISGNGIIGYIEIPRIGCSLPVYHSVEESVLQIAVGHMEWTHLPIGGEGTHSVLSGHRGLPSAKLFTDLDKLELGDTFILRVMDEIFTYEVDQILIVEPEQTEALLPVEGKDLCTLVTCTPYAINTHRLLVRGHRVENAEEAKVVRVTIDAVRIEPMIVAPIVAIPMLLILLLILWIRDGAAKRRKQ